MKYLALLAVLAMPLQADDKEICDILADIGYSIAVQRDQGISHRKIRNRIYTRVDSEWQSVFLDVSDIIYMRPFYTADEEARGIFSECMENSGLNGELTRLSVL